MNANTAGIWDNEKLVLNFEIEELSDWGMDNLSEIFGEEPEPEIEEDDFEEPDEDDIAEIETDIEQGDYFILGEHRILCGDSTKYEDVVHLLGGEDVKSAAPVRP